MPVQTVFTSRRDGRSLPPYDENNLSSQVGDDVEAVAANRAALASGLGAQRIVFMRQVHGTGIGVVDASTPDEVDGVDALLTDVPGLAVAVLVADCVPVLVHGERAVAVVHAGRRGVRAGLVGRAVAALRALDDGPLAAEVGPAICGRCYEVPPDMQADVAAAVPATRCTTARGTTGLDLRAGVAAQLEAAGVIDVRHLARCTAEDATCYSHRRDGRTGRFSGLAMISG